MTLLIGEAIAKHELAQSCHLRLRRQDVEGPWHHLVAGKVICCTYSFYFAPQNALYVLKT